MGFIVIAVIYLLSKVIAAVSFHSGGILCVILQKNKIKKPPSEIICHDFSFFLRMCGLYMFVFSSFLACNSLMKTKLKHWWFYSLILRASYTVKTRCKCTWKWLSTLLTQSEVFLRLLLLISLFLYCCSISICPQESLVSS